MKKMWINKASFILAAAFFAAAASYAPSLAHAGESGPYPELPYKEFIFPLGLIPSSHASSIAELPNGDLYAVWHASWAPKSVIWGSRRPAGGDKWTLPSIINRTPGHGNKNPVLYFGPDEKLWLFWGIEKRWPFKIIEDTIWLKKSSDFGRTWDEAGAVKVLPWFLGRTHPIKLQDGSILLPVYTDLCTSSAAVISRDCGLTWKGPRYILFFFGIQPTIIQRPDLSLFALMRTGTWPRFAWQAVSRDGGRSWKEQRLSNVRNPGFSLEMIKLDSGNVVMAFNNARTDRDSLSIALSRDGGRTWPHVRMIECKAGHVYGYPSVIQDKHGLIHVVYSYDNRNTIAHFVTNEQWLMK
ncbi:MAG: exo-alpha-sialidase [Candidatus Omnitrophota bacterium]